MSKVTIPNEILFHILQFVPRSEMGNLRSVSRDMRQVVDKTLELEKIKIKKDAELILKGLPKIKGIR